MPQIAKGGKYIFGWSKIGENGEIRIPEEAVLEYGREMNKKVILMSGSKTSGGFVIARKNYLEQPKLNILLIQNPQLTSFQIDEGSVIKFNGRFFCWVRFHENGLLNLPLSARLAFEIEAGDHLLSTRGSGLRLQWLSKDTLSRKQKNTPKLKDFHRPS